MFTKNIFQNIVVKRGFLPVEKHVHARVKKTLNSVTDKILICDLR